jgi:putative intracellular protease/amidase
VRVRVRHNSEKPGHLFALTVDWDAVVADHSHYDGLIIPGGRAPEYLRLDQQLLAIVQSFKDKPIASLCHGPQSTHTLDHTHTHTHTQPPHTTRTHDTHGGHAQSWWRPAC